MQVEEHAADNGKPREDLDEERVVEAVGARGGVVHRGEYADAVERLIPAETCERPSGCEFAQRLDQERTEIQRVRERKTQAEEELDAVRAELAQAESDFQDLRTKAAEEQREIQEIRKERDGQRLAVESAQRERKELDDAVARAATELGQEQAALEAARLEVQKQRAALAELKQELPTYALLPNIPEYVRDSSDLGLVGAALKRVRRASPPTLARLGITGLSHALAVLQSDFTGMVPLLIELEAAALDARDLRAVVLAAPLTDLALAGRHRAFFEHYGAFVRGRFGAAAGFETHNLGHLLTRLREWGITPDLVVGPINPLGLLMKPSPDELLEALRASKVPVLAKEVRAAGAVPLVEGARYALDHGAHGVVADLVDLEDLTAELRALKA